MKGLRQRLFPLLLGLPPVLALMDMLGTVVLGVALPTAAYLALGLALASLAALAARPFGNGAMITGGAIFALAGALLAFLPYANLKRLHRAAASVDVGMTRADVAKNLGSRLELTDPWPWPNPGPLELWCGDGPGLVECRVEYDPSDRVVKIKTRFETPWSDFSRVVASVD